MRCNTEVMSHMISHVPACVPGQPESPVCQYCCAAFSSKHQMNTHVFEAHTKFGHSDGEDMVVCAICEEKFFGQFCRFVDRKLIRLNSLTIYCNWQATVRCSLITWERCTVNPRCRIAAKAATIGPPVTRTSLIITTKFTRKAKPSSALTVSG